MELRNMCLCDVILVVFCAGRFADCWSRDTPERLYNRNESINCAGVCRCVKVSKYGECYYSLFIACSGISRLLFIACWRCISIHEYLHINSLIIIFTPGFSLQAYTRWLQRVLLVPYCCSTALLNSPWILDQVQSYWKISHCTFALINNWGNFCVISVPAFVHSLQDVLLAHLSNCPYERAF